MKDEGCDIGLFGLGVMGRNFALNMGDLGFSVGVFNRTAESRIGRYHLERGLYYKGPVAGRYPESLCSSARPSKPSFGFPIGQGRDGQAGKSQGCGLYHGPSGDTGARVDGVSLLF